MSRETTPQPTRNRLKLAGWLHQEADGSSSFVPDTKIGEQAPMKSFPNKEAQVAYFKERQLLRSANTMSHYPGTVYEVYHDIVTEPRIEGVTMRPTQTVDDAAEAVMCLVQGATEGWTPTIEQKAVLRNAVCYEQEGERGRTRHCQRYRLQDGRIVTITVELGP